MIDMFRAYVEREKSPLNASNLVLSTLGTLIAEKLLFKDAKSPFRICDRVYELFVAPKKERKKL